MKYPKLKIPSFVINYHKSDFEQDLENMLKNNRLTLSQPQAEIGMFKGSFSDIFINRIVNGTGNKLTIKYSRTPSIYDAINSSQKMPTSEWIFIQMANLEGSNGYAFDLNSNEKFLDTLDIDFSINQIAPGYNGILCDKYVLDKKGDCITPEITKKKFVKELDKVLKEYLLITRGQK